MIDYIKAYIKQKQTVGNLNKDLKYQQKILKTMKERLIEQSHLKIGSMIQVQLKDKPDLITGAIVLIEPVLHQDKFIYKYTILDEKGKKHKITTNKTILSLTVIDIESEVTVE